MNYVTSTPSQPQEDQVSLKKGNSTSLEGYIYKVVRIHLEHLTLSHAGIWKIVKVKKDAKRSVIWKGRTKLKLCSLSLYLYLSLSQECDFEGKNKIEALVSLSCDLEGKKKIEALLSLSLSRVG